MSNLYAKLYDLKQVSVSDRLKISTKDMLPLKKYYDVEVVLFFMNRPLL